MSDENNKNNKSNQDPNNPFEGEAGVLVKILAKTVGIIVSILILYFIKRTTTCLFDSTSDNVYLRRLSQSWLYQCEVR